MRTTTMHDTAPVLCEIRWCTSMFEVVYAWPGARGMCRGCRTLFAPLEVPLDELPVAAHDEPEPTDDSGGGRDPDEVFEDDGVPPPR